MIPIFRFTSFFCFAAVLAAVTQGQSLANSSDWSKLQRSDQTVFSTKLRSGQTPNPADFIARANELKDYRIGHPNDSTTAEARRLEALMLVYAAANGDQSDPSRRADLVAAVRGDNTLPAADRFTVALLSDTETLNTPAASSSLTHQDEVEKSLRGLVAEFPGVATSYETLLSFAKDCSESKASEIARDLLKLDSPQGVKEGASLLLDRNALIGTSLKTKLNAALAAKDRPTLPKNNLTVVYCWSASVTGTWAIAGEVAAKAPTGATIIGVNLDTDTAAARKIAATQKFPGAQFYDSAGPSSPLARELKLACDNVVIIANRDGTIVSVTARPDLSTKINSAAK